MLAAAVTRLAEWARLMDEAQEARAARLRDYDEWLGEHETRFQEHEARLRQYELRAREREARMQQLDEESQANQVRMSEVIAVLTQIQADLARLDAAS